MFQFKTKKNHNTLQPTWQHWPDPSDIDISSKMRTGKIFLSSSAPTKTETLKKKNSVSGGWHEGKDPHHVPFDASGRNCVISKLANNNGRKHTNFFLLRTGSSLGTWQTQIRRSFFSTRRKPLRDAALFSSSGSSLLTSRWHQIALLTPFTQDKKPFSVGIFTLLSGGSENRRLRENYHSIRERKKGFTSPHIDEQLIYVRPKLRANEENDQTQPWVTKNLPLMALRSLARKRCV